MTLRATIAAFSGINESLFFIFLTAFIIGLLCYGFAFVRAKGLEQKVGLLFLLWAALSVPGYADTVRGTETLSGLFEWVGPYFQPIARALIGVWMWTASTGRIDATLLPAMMPRAPSPIIKHLVRH